MPSTFESASDFYWPTVKGALPTAIRPGVILTKGFKASIRGPTTIAELVKKTKKVSKYEDQKVS